MEVMLFTTNVAVITTSLVKVHKMPKTNPIFSVDPKNNPTPPEYEGVPIQPLGNKHQWYTDLIQGCIDHYGEKGDRCVHNEQERVEMSIRQPQSMVVSLIYARCYETYSTKRQTLHNPMTCLLTTELHQVRFHKDACPRPRLQASPGVLGSQQRQGKERGLASGKHLHKSLGGPHFHGVR